MHTALSLIVEIGDFERFARVNTYAAFLQLASGEPPVQRIPSTTSFRSKISNLGRFTHNQFFWSYSIYMDILYSNIGHCL